MRFGASGPRPCPHVPGAKVEQVVTSVALGGATGVHQKPTSPPAGNGVSINDTGRASIDWAAHCQGPTEFGSFR